MNRVGGPVNHLLSDGGIGSTTIGKATKGSDAGGMFQSLTRTAQTGGADRTILQAFGVISKMCESLGLPKSIKDLSCELFKRAMDQDLVKGRSHSASCAAAIILACRQVPCWVLHTPDLLSPSQHPLLPVTVSLLPFLQLLV